MSGSFSRILTVVALTFVALHPASAQMKVKMGGIHVNEPFCKTMMTQYNVSMAYIGATLGKAPDPKAREKFFSDQRVLNATLVKQAPASLKSDMVQINKDANSSFDLQLKADPKHMMAAMAPLRSPAHLAAVKRANTYCGVTSN